MSRASRAFLAKRRLSPDVIDAQSIAQAAPKFRQFASRFWNEEEDGQNAIKVSIIRKFEIRRPREIKVTE